MSLQWRAQRCATKGSNARNADRASFSGAPFRQMPLRNKVVGARTSSSVSPGSLRIVWYVGLSAMVECDTFRSRRFFLPRKRSTSNLHASAKTSADSEDSPCWSKAQRAANNKRRRRHPSSLPRTPAASANASVSILDRPSRTSTRTCLRINQLPWHAKANANGPMVAFKAFETASLFTDVDLYKSRERSSSSNTGGQPPGG